MAKKIDCKLACCTTPKHRIPEIQMDVDEWEPGEWAKRVSYGPACHCGVRGAKVPCPRH